LPFEPSPRPTRVFGVFAPGAGRRWWTLSVIPYSTSSTVTRWVTVATMPRISGRSSLTTASCTRFSPSDRSVCRWLSFDPMADRTWVTFSRATSHPLTGPHAQHSGRGHVLQREVTARRDLLRPDQAAQRRHGGVHDVDRVVRAERLRQHVVDA